MPKLLNRISPIFFFAYRENKIIFLKLLPKQLDILRIGHRAAGEKVRPAVCSKSYRGKTGEKFHFLEFRFCRTFKRNGKIALLLGIINA